MQNGKVLELLLKPEISLLPFLEPIVFNRQGKPFSCHCLIEVEFIHKNRFSVLWAINKTLSNIFLNSNFGFPFLLCFLACWGAALPPGTFLHIKMCFLKIHSDGLVPLWCLVQTCLMQMYPPGLTQFKCARSLLVLQCLRSLEREAFLTRGGKHTHLWCGYQDKI